MSALEGLGGVGSPSEGLSYGKFQYGRTKQSNRLDTDLVGRRERGGYPDT
jgi:hypothetical protein